MTLQHVDLLDVASLGRTCRCTRETVDSGINRKPGRELTPVPSRVEGRRRFRGVAQQHLWWVEREDVTLVRSGQPSFEDKRLVTRYAHEKSKYQQRNEIG